MLPAINERSRWLLVVIAAALALVAFDAWWIATFRDGYPFNIDEAGYTSFSLIDYFGLRGGGLHGWWDAIQVQAPHAPLVPALTSLLLVVKPGVLDGFVTLAGFLVLLGLACYGIGERLAGPRLGALAAVVVMASPGAFIYSREFVFALPTAALLASAAYALLRSEGFRRSRWSFACGIAIGLMLLARTMTVAFIPGLLAAGILVMFARRVEWRRGFLNLGLTAVTAAAVAATWYWRNLQSVIDYLTGFGYGAQSTTYGESHSPASWGWWKSVAVRITAEDLLVPLAALVLAGLLAIGVTAVRRVLQAPHRREAVESLLRSDAVSIAIVFAAGYLALSSTRNIGNGFTFPLAVLLPPLAVVALHQYQRAIAPALALIACLMALNVVAASTAWDAIARTRTVEIPDLGALPWSRGVPHVVRDVRVQVPGPETRFEERDRGWVRANEELAEFIMDDLGTPTTTPVVAFGTRNRIVNINSVGLAALLKYQRGIPVAQLQSESGGDSVAAYASQLSDPIYGPPTVLVTMNRNTDDYPPLVTQSYAEAAGRRLGFRKVRTIALPDGRLMRVWAKQDEPAAEKPAAKPKS